MPRCIECMSSIQRVVNPETNTVERCPTCAESVDMYFEFGDTQKWIDMALLQKRAWVHTVCNEPSATLRYVLFAVLCCFLQAFVIRTHSVFSMEQPETPGEQATFSLQIVKILQNPTRLAAMRYPSTLPRLMFYATMEYLLLLAVAVWLGSNLRPKMSKYEEVLEEWVRAFSLAAALRVAYAIFLIWNVPVSLLPIVDCLFFVWLYRGISVLTIDHSSVSALLSMLLCTGARAFFRHLTHWCKRSLI